MIQKKSLYEESWAEAQKHKWLESEKVGEDLGDRAIAQWNESHWWKWCRARWIEHLMGEVFWIEIDKGNFGVLRKQFSHKQILLDRIIDRVRAGYENLDIILWASKWGLNLPDVIEILQELDINSSRIKYR